MRSIQSSLLFVLPFLLFSCGSGKSPEVSPRDPEKVTAISEDEIFSGDIVKNFVVSGDKAMKEANQLFLQAIDTYRNKKDPAGSIALFVRSICINPESAAYYEMGNASMDAGDTEHAISCFDMAEKLGYEPFSKVLYNLACAYSKKEI
jgi:tetratricopeptide (TPR) repeat protein